MDLHLYEPEELPRPREEMRVQGLEITAYPDRRRVRVAITLSAFRERPSLDLLLIDSAGETVSTVSIIEAMHNRMAVTLHLRAEPPARARYTLRAVLFYAPSPEQREQDAQAPDQVVHALDVPFELPAEAPPEVEDADAD